MIRNLLESKRILSITLMAVMIVLAWSYLLLMTQSMRGDMDMAEMGMGMGVFNLSHDLVHQIAPTLCTDTSLHESTTVLSHNHDGTAHASTPERYFGMPSLGKNWDLADATQVFIMWIMMMIAMMLPTAAPMIICYNDILNNQSDSKDNLASVTSFISGYLLVWGAYSLLAVAAQWLMLQNGLINDMMVGANAKLNGSILIVAGLYQWTSLKEVCLTHCRTPLQFFLSSWQPGIKGALRMGAKHGAFCVGCCWALMILMFFFGLMNLLWIAGLSLIMLTEKIIPRGDLFGKVIGLLFIIWGLSIVGGHLYQ